ncbi:MAG: prephenate dehydrogenase [Acutalibacteraceae bacterium]
MIDKNEKILIVGLGLLGGSYAEILTEKGFEVGAVDINKDSVEFALKKGIIAHGTTEPSEDYLKEFDLVVLALYPSAAVEWVKKYQSFLKSGVLITDVTGVKCSVVYKIQSFLRDDAEFVGAHPMAGREVSGVRNAAGDMFLGANYIVTPTDKNSPEAIARCEDLGRIIGCRCISRLTPELHDEMVGFLSQLTHCIAVALMACKDSQHLADYTGDSFRDLTRIAKINEEMWSELFIANKEQLLEQMELFLDKFIYIRDALRNSDSEALKDIMRLSTKRRKIFDRQENKQL